MTDARGNATSYGYDNRGRMTSLDQPDVATDLTWTYQDNADGTSTKTQTNRGASAGTVTWTYDPAGRLVSRAYRDAADATRTTTYAYTGAGSAWTATDTAGTISATNDRTGRPVSVTVSGDTAATTSFLVPQVSGPDDLGGAGRDRRLDGDQFDSRSEDRRRSDVGRPRLGLHRGGGWYHGNGTWADFTVRDADGVVTHVNGFRVIGAKPDAMWKGADGIGIADISTVAITPGGWDLRRWGDNGAWIAVRGDRLFTFPGGELAPTRDQVQTFLDALE
jgi:YD repeat-containing protein